MKAGWRGVWRLWHRWLGLSIGLYLALMGATGAAVLFREEIEAARYRVSAGSGAAPLPADALVTVVRARYPDVAGKDLSRVDIPADSDVCRRFVFGGYDDLTRTRFVYIHPYTGATVSNRYVLRDPFGFIWAAHLFLLGGTRGMTWHGWLGIGATALLLTGLAAWLPTAMRQLRARFTAKGALPTARLLYDAHTLGGAAVLPLLLVLSVTGTAFPWEDALHKAFRLPESRPHRVPQEGTLPIPADALLRTAEQRLPDLRVRRLILPTKPTEVARVQMIARRPALLARATVTLNPYTGAVIAVTQEKETEGAERLLTILPALHFGAWGGTVGKMLYAIAGLAAPGLFLSGCYLYLRRRRKRA
ncbi:MAG: PepSY domain-containing protein [Fibrella sp.]|nr:PepSY domain-containing protein [Armatimonadota bacterium]